MDPKEQSWLEKARESAGWLVFFGIVEIVAGVLALASPLLAGLAVTVMIGVAFLIGGGARLVVAFKADSFGTGALTFFWGLVAAATGFYVVVRPAMGLASLTLVVAMSLFVEGVLRIVIAFKLKPVKGWGWMLSGGILSIVFAMMIGWEFPASSLWVVGTLVGVSLLFAGFTTINLAGAARQVVGTTQKAA